MTDKQPKALKIADYLMKEGGALDQNAAAELRRLHEVNAELVEALSFIAGHYLSAADLESAGHMAHMFVYRAKAALAKATGENNDNT
jgi:hypothetical protein